MTFPFLEGIEHDISEIAVSATTYLTASSESCSAEQLTAAGAVVFARACELGLEGIV
jgi:hypothetical protein